MNSQQLRILLCLTILAGFSPAHAAPAVMPAATAPSPARKLPFDDEIATFEAADKLNPPPLGAVLFTGSSNIRIWSTLAQDFPELTVINRGFGGSLMESSVDYFDRVTLPYKPHLIVLSAGTNDLANRHSAANVLSDFQKYVAKVHAALPRTRVVFLSIAPSIARNNRSLAEKNSAIEANNLIAQYIRENDGKVAPMTFIDTYSFLLTPDGAPRPDIFQEDKHHFNAEGYAALAALVRPPLLALMGTKAGAPKLAPSIP